MENDFKTQVEILGKDLETQINMPNGNTEFTLGSGVVKALIGSGGMATVYKIWNERLEVYRAVKILRPSSNPAIRDRFETEIKISAKLHHANIVEIHTVGEWNGMPYIEMEYIDGVSIDALIREGGALSAETCTSLGIMIARGLDYAHTQDFSLYGNKYKGVIHRDLKPQNIMIDHRGLVKIMDFGIARPAETSLHTIEHNIIGTPQYLAPEQIDGKPVDARTDIYAFGTVLYEMLTATKTFPQETLTDLIRKKLSNSYSSFNELDLDVPKALTNIIQKCLQTDMRARYSNARELIDNLMIVHKKLSNKTPEDFLRTKIGVEKGFSKTQINNLTRQNDKKNILKEHFDKIKETKARFIVIGSLLVGILLTVVLTTIFKHEENAPGSKTKSNATAPIGSVQNEIPPKPEPQSNSEKITNPRENNEFGRLVSSEAEKSKPAVKNIETETWIPLKKIPVSNTSNSLPESKIKRVAKEKPSEDGADICEEGNQLLKQGKSEEALVKYQNALDVKTTKRQALDVRRDALFGIAVCYKNILVNNPSKDKVDNCKNAWLVVKKMYETQQSSERYQRALLELENLE